MASLLRPGMARRLCGSMIQRTQAAVPEDRRRLGTRFLHTKERIAEGKRRIKEASPKQDGYDWRQFPYMTALATFGNEVIKGALLLAVASEVDLYWLFGIDRPEEKERA